MAYFEEDHLSCLNTDCNSSTFVAKEVLKIDKRVGTSVTRDIKSLPLPEHLVEKEIIYVCNECGTPLDV